MRVSTELLDAAVVAYNRLNPQFKHEFGYASFIKDVGITTKQWDYYNESWILYVRKPVHRKLTVLASGSQHWRALFKVIDAT